MNLHKFFYKNIGANLCWNPILNKFRIVTVHLVVFTDLFVGTRRPLLGIAYSLPPANKRAQVLNSMLSKMELKITQETQFNIIKIKLHNLIKCHIVEKPAPTLRHHDSPWSGQTLCMWLCYIYAILDPCLSATPSSRITVSSRRAGWGAPKYSVYKFD